MLFGHVFVYGLSGVPSAVLTLASERRVRGVMQRIRLSAIPGRSLSLHGEMSKDAAPLQWNLDQLAQQIDRVSRELLSPSKDLSAEEAAALAHDLEVRQGNYTRGERLPTWPIDVGLALRFAVTQIVPVLSLTGLSTPLVDVIDRLAHSVAPG